MFLVITLWSIGMSQIGGHLRQGVFTGVRLATMAVTISLLAVATIVVAGAAFFGAPSGAFAREGDVLGRSGCTAEVRGAFVFSFGLEQGSRPVSGCSTSKLGD